MAPSVTDEANSDAFLERLTQRLAEIGNRITIGTSPETSPQNRRPTDTARDRS
jgi:hypothetical protein